MGDYVPEVKEEIKVDEEAPDMFEKLEKLIRFQLSSEELPVRDVLTAFGTPIVSVGILDAGIITGKVLGNPRPGAESTESFDNETLFQAASISKAVTALAVLKLCQLDELDLDAPISGYLSSEQMSWISTSQTQALVSQISIRLLLSHTSGLRVHGFDGYSNTAIPSVQQILHGDPPANNEQISLFTLPGVGFYYSGGGFTVIQLILETHLKKPFHQIMDETVLQPLNMTRSTYNTLDSAETNYAPAYLTGKNKSDPEYHVYPEKAAAALWTTPSDLLKAVLAVQKSLKTGGFLDRKWAEIMLTQAGDNEAGMALGWVAKKGSVYFWHTGGNPPGYRCIVVGYADLPLYEEEAKGKEKEKQSEKAGVEDAKADRTAVPEQCGICIMTSSQLGTEIRSKILQAIPCLRSWPSTWDNPTVPFLDRARSVDGRAKDWCGEWGPGDWNLVYKEERMFVRFGKLPAMRLVPGVLLAKKHAEGNSIDLVADGLDLMLRLGWKEGSRSIEVWQNAPVITLEQKS